MPTARIGRGRKVVIPDDVLDDLHTIAAHRGETVSETIRVGLRAYTARVLKKPRRAA